MCNTTVGFCEQCKCWWNVFRGGRLRFPACPACGERLVDKAPPPPATEIRPGVYAEW